jgi:hypothetical protein
MYFVWFNVRQHNNGYIDVSFWERKYQMGFENSQRNKARHAPIQN